MTRSILVSGTAYTIHDITIAEAMRSTGGDANFAVPGTYNLWTDASENADPVLIGGGLTSLEEAIADAEREMRDQCQEHRPTTYIARVEFILDAVESAAKEARDAKGVEALAQALNNLRDACSEARRDPEHALDWHALPTFGGEEPKDTDGVWSWDKYRIVTQSADGSYYTEPRA